MLSGTSTTDKPSSTLDKAQRYVDAGISVVPIRRDGSKAPAWEVLPRVWDEHEQRNRATWKPFTQRLPTDEELRLWFDRPDPYGIGTIGGPISGCLEQLDFDRLAQEIYPAWQALVEAERPGLVERLAIIQTPRQPCGYHVKARCPDEDIPGNTKLAIDPTAPSDDRVLIETRGTGGYCVAPGSPAQCHSQRREYIQLSGPVIPPVISPEERECLWRCARSFNREIKTFPQQRGLDLRPGEDYDRRGPDWAEILEPAGWKCVHGNAGGERRWRRPGKEDPGWSATTGHCSGQDGADLLRVFSSNAQPLEDGRAYGKFRAHSLLHHGGDLSAAADELARQGYGSRRTPGPAPSGNGKNSSLHGRQSQNLVFSAAARGFGIGGPYKPFPIDALPSVLGDYVGAAAAAIGCDPALVALPALAVAAAAIGNSRSIRLKKGWTEPAVIWAVTVAPSGELKSPGWDAASRPYTAIQMDLVDEAEAKCEKWEAEMEAWRENGKAGEKPKRPPDVLTHVTTDSTIWTLGERMRNNPRGILLSRDEVDGWFQGLTRFAGNQATDRPHWLELNRAGTLLIDRMSRDKSKLAVRRAACSITGTIQPLVLACSITDEDLAAGLLARILLANPPKTEKRWTEAEVSEELVAQYDKLLRNLLVLKLQDEAKREPHILEMGAAAKKVWVAWYNHWAGRQFNSQAEQAAVLAKLEAYAVRLALVHHVVRHVANGTDALQEIGESSLRAGIKLAEWFADEALRVYQTIRLTREEREQRDLVEWIHAHGGRITARELRESCKGRYPTSADAEAALAELVEAGLGKWEPNLSGAQGGRPTQTFVLTLPRNPETPENCGDDEVSGFRGRVGETEYDHF
jgi:hypothetical protein